MYTILPALLIARHLKASVLAPVRATVAVLLAFLMAMVWASPAAAHEVAPAIADMRLAGGALEFEVRLNLEPLLAGVDLAAVTDTNLSPQAAQYDALRALAPGLLEERFRAFWPTMAKGIHIKAQGLDLPIELTEVSVLPNKDLSIVRPATLRFRVKWPAAATTVDLGWAPEFGPLVVRQLGVESPYDGYLEKGATTGPVKVGGGDQASALQTFVHYIPIGFDHIVPKGLDHILFVLGLFFMSTRMGPLLWQISAFTVAHTITLALASLGYVSIPAQIVEPLIAASIVVVAIENIYSQKLSRWRIAVVFGFGLLHGLGFASVLAEFGLPANAFFSALIGFNVGVELGQLAVIATAFMLTAHWFGDKPWYRRRIATPASVLIAAIGAWWFVERVFL